MNSQPFRRTQAKNYASNINVINYLSKSDILSWSCKKIKRCEIDKLQTTIQPSLRPSSMPFFYSNQMPMPQASCLCPPLFELSFSWYFVLVRLVIKVLHLFHVTTQFIQSKTLIYLLFVDNGQFPRVFTIKLMVDSTFLCYYNILFYFFPKKILHQYQKTP